jgi:hypothetical protein
MDKPSNFLATKGFLMKILKRGLADRPFCILYLLASIYSLPTCLNAQAYDTLQQEIKEEFAKATQYNDIPNTLLLLKLIVDDAVRKGAQAPDYNLCKLHIKNTHLFCEENKGIERVNMPQLVGKPVPNTPAALLPVNIRGEVDATNNFSDYLENNKKYNITNESVPATSLKATQNEIVGSKVAGIWLATQDPNSTSYKTVMESPIFISRDNYVLDGHHRWAASIARAISQGSLDQLYMKAKRVDVGIDQLVKDANEFAQEFGIQEEKGL